MKRTADPEAFVASMPPAYFEHVNPAYHPQHELFLDYFRGDQGEGRVFNFQGDNEQYLLHNFDPESIRRHLVSAIRALRDQPFLYRSYVNTTERFILHEIIPDPQSMESSSAGEPLKAVFQRFRESFLDERGRVARHIVVSYDQVSRDFQILCVNVAHQTLVSNLWEVLGSHLVDVDFVEVARTFDPAPQVRTFYRVIAHCTRPQSDREVSSISTDFARYIRHFTFTMSLFDLVGPAMVGPSSSHTAGANRIGQICRSIILAVAARGETVRSVRVRLLGSFADTGVGHKTPVAIAGGLAGLDTDDEAMLRMGSPEYLASHGIDFGGVTARFDGFTRGTPADLAVYHSDKCSNIAEVFFVTDRAEYVVTGFSIGAGNVEIRHFGGPLAEPLTGKRDMFLKGDTIVAMAAPDEKLPVVRRIFEGASPDDDYVLRFNSFEELIDHCRDRDMSLLDVVVSVESAYQRTSPDEIHAQMLAYWKRMERSVTAGVCSTRASMFGLSGGSACRMDGYLKDNRLFDNIWGRAAAYATAVNEQNARSGVIVACPTAGSCGILPGVLKAYAEMTDVPEDRIVQALLIAGFLGMLLFSDVSTSGAAYGCQAEIGSAAAMAAAAVCFLEGGDVEQIIAAFILAIKNSLGLICDPIAGLVEVPCVKRNGIYSSMAITAAMMALSGVKSFVSPDEVILVMREVGEKLSSDYKETARGGLAQTRDGKYVEKMFEAEIRRFFSDSPEYNNSAEHSD